MGRSSTFAKADFLPDVSFESLESYLHALRETPHRFKDRIFARADAFEEVSKIRGRSGHNMKRSLTSWDLAWLTVGAVVGTGVFVLTGKEAHDDAGPAVVLSYALAGMSAMLCVFCYTEFAVEIPVAGGSFAYLRVELGDFVAFLAAGNIFLGGLVGNAALGRSWTSYFATLLNRDPDELRIYTDLTENFNLLDPIAMVVLILAALLATVSIKGVSTLNWIASVITFVIIAFIIIAGILNGTPSNFTPFMPYGIRGIVRGACVLFFSYLGFDAVATLAEETVNPTRDIPIALLSSMSTVMLLYCLMAVTLCLLQNYLNIDVNAPFSSAFRDVAGWSWAQYIVSLGALKSMTSVLLMQMIGQARYLTYVARTHLIPPWFGRVNAKTSTPINATAVVALSSGIIAFFSSLNVLANLVSLITLLTFTLVALSLLVRRYYVKGETSRQHYRLLVIFLVLILASSSATAIYWACSAQGWVGYIVTLPVWFLSTLGLTVFVPKARKPSFWGVPFVPWFPSFSMLTNVFLLGSLDGASFIWFAVFTAFVLIYYVFYGLHASYDAAHSITTLEYEKLGGGEAEEAARGEQGGEEQEDGIAFNEDHVQGEIKYFH